MNFETQASTASIDPGASGGARVALSQMEIDLDAVAANLTLVRQRAGPKRTIIAALKADAYGHGAVALAQRLEREGVDFLAVGSLDEGAAIRAAGVRSPTVLLSALVPEIAADVLDLSLIPTIDAIAPARELSQLSRGRTTSVFIKVDCGFGRFGVRPGAAVDFARAVAGLDSLTIEGVYTHIPFADSLGREWARRRLAAFDRVVVSLANSGIRPRVTQALASPGLLGGLDNPHSAVAVGHALYGLNPLGPTIIESGSADVLCPALIAIRTRLVHVGLRPPLDEAAPYLHNSAGPVGVIPIGIHHSYRPVAKEAFVVVAGQVAPVLRPCLENSVIDLAVVPDARVGTEVLVLGTAGRCAISLDNLASWHLTSPLSVLCGFGRSLPRTYRGL